MANRIELHKKLKEILGNANVYFQPPSSVKLKYPCIVYKLSRINTNSANNSPYIFSHLYELTLIEREPDTGVAERLMLELNARFDRPFTSDNLYHTVLTLNY